MDVGGDLIWGDDSQSEVFAQAQSRNVCIIFRCSWNPKCPQSLPSRIVTCYHGLPAEDAWETFPNRGSMREALYASIRGIWDQCTRHPSVTAADVTVEIYEDAERQNQWRISHESLYNQYVESLLLVGRLFRGGEAKLQAYNTMDYSSLVHIRYLGGRGRTALVRSSETLYVFKGLDFGAFLESRTDFQHQKDVCYHEIRTISSLPPHPNIIPLSNTFVTVRKIGDDQQAFVCGALYPFMERAWCFQMASAIAHAHFTAHTYHMDIKPANFVLNARKDLVLIDWEQSGAALYTLAPEADGSWDVKEATTGASYPGITDSTEPKLVYEKYSGPYRENLAWGRPKWNVFPSWRDFYPRALDAAEVFSLGRTMWMLLEQVTQSEVEEREQITVSWSDFAEDIPEDWKGIVSRCLDPDPNERVGLLELVDFWKTLTCKDGALTECASIFPHA